MKKISFSRLIILGLLLIALAAVTVVSAQGLLALDWWTVDSGGGQSQAGQYALNGGIGQSEAAEAAQGGVYTLQGGFWAGGQPAEIKILVHLPFILRH